MASAMTRQQAWEILCRFTQGESLRRHALAVEAAMAFYARRFGEDEELWRVVGLLHDFDYEQNPSPPDHTREGARILRGMGVEETIVGAVLSHAEWNLEEYPRDTGLRRTLFAVDEMSGFLMACAWVRPTRLEGLEPKSVRKKIKTPAFAAAVSRSDLHTGAEILDLSLDEHIANCLEALRAVAPDLGLPPPGQG